MCAFRKTTLANRQNSITWIGHCLQSWRRLRRGYADCFIFQGFVLIHGIQAPILSQQRAEYERLQQESGQLASQLSQALAERDTYAQSSEEHAQKLAKSSRENTLLQKQLDDLGRQIRVLLKELSRMQDPSLPSDAEFEFEENLPPAENVEEVITNNLVVFRSLPQLQQQNQKLLKVVRDLGARMEAEEKDYRATLEHEQSEAVREAHEAIKQLQEQLESQSKSSEVTIQAYMKERDSLRALLARQNGGQTLPSIVNGDVNGNVAPVPVSASALQVPQSELAKELAEVQSQFEAYKNEIGIDSHRLREEASLSQRESNQLRAALAKANAKIEFLDGEFIVNRLATCIVECLVLDIERHHMVQDQALVQERELNNLSKRNQDLYDQYMRIDIECNRVSEELLVATGHVEQLRNECANLRAEKKIWHVSCDYHRLHDTSLTDM